MTERDMDMQMQGDRIISALIGLVGAVSNNGKTKQTNPGHAREIVGTMAAHLRVPKTTYFSAAMMLDSVRRFAQPPQKSRRRFVHNPEFPDMLDFNRIVARAEGRDEKILDQWDALSRQVCKEQGKDHE